MKEDEFIITQERINRAVNFLLKNCDCKAVTYMKKIGSLEVEILEIECNNLSLNGGGHFDYLKRCKNKCNVRVRLS